ncbi:hypothetical protein [Microbispora sp. KK1-11]|uniref:hypothetical protein n=1 Tax=Microbispora sp. KK1-11 TaxID=2053005 RepID=UPI00115A1377|nr:hypothetical protein [Microbispora sp. KK1-11]TQS18635.1 hypothetical protein FLW16_42490 [Microbispora sp. KK1-11]
MLSLVQDTDEPPSDSAEQPQGVVLRVRPIFLYLFRRPIFQAIATQMDKTVIGGRRHKVTVAGMPAGPFARPCWVAP